MPKVRPADLYDLLDIDATQDQVSCIDTGTVRAIEHGGHVIGIYGCAPFKDGCLLWFEGTDRMKDAGSWLIRNAKEILSEVVYGKYVVVEVDHVHTVVQKWAKKCGFEPLSVYPQHTLYYMTIDQ